MIVESVELAGLDKIDEAEDVALTLEFKHDINAYLAGLGGEHPADLAGLIAFNEAHAASVLTAFGQEQFEASQATSGDISDREYLDARAAATGAARSALDGALLDGRLDALVYLTGSPTWLIDPVLGDAHRWGTSSPAAVSGYPSITVPAGQMRGLPVGLSFTGPAWSEPRLIALAHSFELAAR